jgi:hypothetical protein
MSVKPVWNNEDDVKESEGDAELKRLYNDSK